MPISYKGVAVRPRSLFFLISATLNAVHNNQVFNSTKVLLAGDFIEATRFKKRFDWSEQDVEKNKNFSIYRSRTTLKRLINMNAGKWYDEENKRFFLPQFVTFTFAFNEVEVSAANAEFVLFIKRLNRALGYKKSVLKYSAVVEFQDRGAVHYHVLFYNMPFVEHNIQFFRRVWTWGNVMPKSVWNIADLGSYLTKYMVKGFDDQRLFGKKRYWNSRFLKKPVLYTEDDPECFAILEQCRWKKPFYEFENENIKYQSYWFGNSLFKGFKVPHYKPRGYVSVPVYKSGLTVKQKGLF